MCIRDRLAPGCDAGPRVVAMAVNPDFAGRTYPPSGPYAVDAALIAAFAAAVGSTDPVHTDAAAAQAAGYGDVIAPPTMAVRFSQQLSLIHISEPTRPY